MKSREERETAVEDPEAVRAILARLGYRPLFRYQKYRESWTHRGQEVEVDETPIGVFLEIEGDARGHPRGGQRSSASRPPTTSPSPTSASSSPAGGQGDMVFPRMKAMVLAAGHGLRMRPLTRCSRSPRCRS